MSILLAVGGLVIAMFNPWGGAFLVVLGVFVHCFDIWAKGLLS